MQRIDRISSSISSDDEILSFNLVFQICLACEPSRHLDLHLFEVFFLFVAKLVVMECFHRGEVEPVCHAGKITCQQAAGIRLLFIDLNDFMMRLYLS